MILIVGMNSVEYKSQLQQLGMRVRDLRMKKSLTQVELANKCNFDRNYIGMLERGERNPSYVTLLKIAHGLGISLYQLIKF